MIPDKQKHLEGLYRKVVKDFPEISEEEIEVKYDPFFSDLNIIFYLNIKKARIKAGIDFFDESREEQEAGIAHELGHYMDDNSKSIIRLKHSMKLQKKLHKWLKYYNYLSRRKLEILKDHDIMIEISADNWAVKKGYAQGLLKALNPIYDKYDRYDNIILNIKEKERLKFSKEHFAKRIANIEQKIKEK